MGLYKIGAPVTREEDSKLLRGRGRYCEDVRMANEARAFVLRSPTRMRASLPPMSGARSAAPGVIAVLTGEDVRARAGHAHARHTAQAQQWRARLRLPAAAAGPGAGALCRRTLAFVVAETPEPGDGRGRADRVSPTSRCRRSITAEAALAPGAPALWDDNPGNEAFFHEVGDKARRRCGLRPSRPRRAPQDPRSTGSPPIRMEPRGCVGAYDRDQDAIRSAAPSSRRTARAPRSPSRSSSCRRTGSGSSATIWAAGSA